MIFRQAHNDKHYQWKQYLYTSLPPPKNQSFFTRKFLICRWWQWWWQWSILFVCQSINCTPPVLPLILPSPSTSRHILFISPSPFFGDKNSLGHSPIPTPNFPLFFHCISFFCYGKTICSPVPKKSLINLWINQNCQCWRRIVIRICVSHWVSEFYVCLSLSLSLSLSLCVYFFCKKWNQVSICDRSGVHIMVPMHHTLPTRHLLLPLHCNEFRYHTKVKAAENCSSCVDWHTLKGSIGGKKNMRAPFNCALYVSCQCQMPIVATRIGPSRDSVANCCIDLST